MGKSSAGDGEDRRDGPKFDEIKNRLDNLGGKLERVRERNEPSEADEARGRAMGGAFRIATELVAGVFVGGLFGWSLDAWLRTAPAFLIVFLLLGVAAGLLNAVKAAKNMQKDL